jgi:hypothetical protein
VRTVALYWDPSAKVVVKLKIPLLEMLRFSAPLYCSTMVPLSPVIVPPICLWGTGVGVGEGGSSHLTLISPADSRSI